MSVVSNALPWVAGVVLSVRILCFGFDLIRMAVMPDRWPQSSSSSFTGRVALIVDRSSARNGHRLVLGLGIAAVMLVALELVGAILLVL